MSRPISNLLTLPSNFLLRVSMKINPNLSGMGNLLELVNAANPGKNFTSVQVAVKSVTARTPDYIPFNSEAVLTGTPAGPYKDDQTVFYNRRPITEAVANPPVGYEVTDEMSTNDLLLSVCAILRIVPTEVELVDLVFEPGSSVSTMTLQPTANSKLYINTFEIQLLWTGDGVSDAVAVLWAGDQLDKLINITMPSRGYL